MNKKGETNCVTAGSKVPVKPPAILARKDDNNRASADEIRIIKGNRERDDMESVINCVLSPNSEKNTSMNALISNSKSNLIN